MTMPTSTRLTTGDVARALGIDIEEVVELVYRGELEGHPDARTGRLLIEPSTLALYREQHPVG